MDRYADAPLETAYRDPNLLSREAHRLREARTPRSPMLEEGIPVRAAFGPPVVDILVAIRDPGRSGLPTSRKRDRLVCARGAPALGWRAGARMPRSGLPLALPVFSGWIATRTRRSRLHTGTQISYHGRRIGSARRGRLARQCWKKGFPYGRPSARPSSTSWSRFGIPEGRVFPLLVSAIAWCALGELLRSAGAQERACLAPDSRSRFLSFRDGSLRGRAARDCIPGPKSLITGGASAPRGEDASLANAGRRDSRTGGLRPARRRHLGRDSGSRKVGSSHFS